MRKKYFRAFTLVELIIVITILAVLATIAFVSFSNYTKSARDTSRVSTLANVEKGLDIYFVQVGNLPIPSNPQTFTGGNNGNLSIKQGTLTKDVLQTLDKTPVDPVSGKEYTYSVFGNGKYYQVAGNLENNISQNLTTKTHANFKTTKLVGNYIYDPSLPSLVIGSGTNIFSPDTCFITNGGTDTLDNCTTKKSDLAGKNVDSSLVGYWDMETLTGTMLKDLSGNGNNGIFTGGLNTSSLTGGFIGSGVNFSGGTYSSILIPDTGGVNIKNKLITNFTISMIFRKGFNDTVMRTLFSTTEGGGINSTFNHSYGTVDCRLNGQTNNLCFLVGNNPYYKEIPLNSNDFYQAYKKIDTVFSEGQMKVFINGILITAGTSNMKSVRLGSPTTPLCLGNEASPGYCWGQPYIGIIDEVKIYNRALTDEEIMQQAKIAGF